MMASGIEELGAMRLAPRPEPPPLPPPDGGGAPRRTGATRAERNSMGKPVGLGLESEAAASVTAAEQRRHKQFEEGLARENRLLGHQQKNHFQGPDLQHVPI